MSEDQPYANAIRQQRAEAAQKRQMARECHASDRQKAEAALAACPIAKGARVTRKGDGGDQWRGTVVGRTTRRGRDGQVFVVCRVRWEPSPGARGLRGATSYSDLQADKLELLG